MAERDPLDRLSEVADAPQQPDSDFAERLLVELLADLHAPSTDAPQTNDNEATVVELEEETDMTNNRKLLWPLVAAAAVAIAVVGAAFAITGDDDDAITTDPPSTTAASEPDDDDDESTAETSSTTETSPTTDASGGADGDDADETQLLSIGAAFLDAYYSGDAADIEALAADDAVLQEVLYNQEYERASNIDVTERSCTVTAERNGVTCNTLATDDTLEILGVPPSPTEFVLRVIDGKIQNFSVNFDNSDELNALFTWITTSRPDIMEGPCAGVLNATGPAAECAIATTEAAAEFVETDDYVAP